MRYCVGIDLGSTTTKSVILGEGGEVLGRGITNSRSNYSVACDVAMAEALIDARFGLLAEALRRIGVRDETARGVLQRLERGFREQQYRSQLGTFAEIGRRLAAERASLAAESDAFEAIVDRMTREAGELFAPGAKRRSDFFRDLAGSRYMRIADEIAREAGTGFDRLAALFDKAILEVENLPAGSERFADHIRAALERTSDVGDDVRGAVDAAASATLECVASVGTGYGRQTLPFPKEQIRSEILCHGLGAHHLYPATRTVLDIGGQDTKAIQVDGRGIVTSFQMNDRCAAGCGRYLGYIADEMNLGVHELGPLACASNRRVRINSTCTVFAGAELRERLSLGERREDILAGLHRAIILRAMSLLARSGGVSNEFTFTGGVANNEAAVAALGELVGENYGDIVMNISPDSIYTGALGAALFAARETKGAAA